MNKKPTDSLSIIEDCLERIYQSRRANLLSKSRKFKEKQARKALDRQEPTSAINNGPSVENRKDYDEQDVLDELEIKYSAPPVASVPYIKERSKVAQQYEDQDAEALVLFRTFCDDLTVLIEESPMRLPEDEFRADHCDLFIQKYFTGHFDKMMGTRLLSKIRKHITHIIEEFSAENNTSHIMNLMKHALADCEGGNLRLKSNTTKDNEEIMNKQTATAPRNEEKLANPGKSVSRTEDPPILKSALKAAVKNEEQRSPDAPIPQHQQQPRGAVDKQKIEKQRMKAQYEQLMTMKKKVENHPDDETVSQYSALHADIQSVIDSIQKNKPVK